MKQSLQLKISQSLTMTPQLQQAIRLLQLPTLELQAEIQQVIESNPMLESEEELTEKKEISDNTNNTENHQNEQDLTTQETSKETNEDDQWENPWENAYPSSSQQSTDNDNIRNLLENQSDTTSSSLHDHLIWQLNLSPLNTRDKTIAAAIIDSINDDGYLIETIANIEDSLNKTLEDLETDEILAVLHLIQHFDPIGVGASNAAECLLLQLNTYPQDILGLAIAKTIVSQHLELLANRDYTRLRKIIKIDAETLKDAELLIQSLNPRPGATMSTYRTEYIVPDVYVSKQKNDWRAELNPELAPRLKINSLYANMIKRADKSDDNTYLRNNLQEARWFLKSLESRNSTILKVANTIIDKQHGFFEYGDEAMKPLILRDIAEQLEMHESTISRVTNQKYMHTPRGIFEFKYFFSSHVGTVDGGECSATAIRAIIKKLIADEDTRKPLSDNKIADLLKNQGISVARRTIAKYRESLAIPPSNERKRLT